MNEGGLQVRCRSRYVTRCQGFFQQSFRVDVRLLCIVICAFSRRLFVCGWLVNKPADPRGDNRIERGRTGKKTWAWGPDDRLRSWNSLNSPLVSLARSWPRRRQASWLLLGRLGPRALGAWHEKEGGLGVWRKA